MFKDSCNHNWVVIYDDDGNIIGRICSTCGLEQ